MQRLASAEIDVEAIQKKERTVRTYFLLDSLGEIALIS